MEAVRAIVGNRWPVHGLVVFAGGAKFPKGMPDGVCSLGSLERHLRAMAYEDIPLLPDDVWQSVIDASSRASADRKKHIGDLQRKHGKDSRERAGMLLIGLGAVIALANLMV